MTNAPQQPETCTYCGLPLTGSWLKGSRSHSSRHTPRAETGDQSSRHTPCAETGRHTECADYFEQRAAYCCIGCRIAASVTDAQGAEGHIRWMLARLGLAIFFTMNVMVFAMALWSREYYGAPAAEHAALAGTLWQLFRYLGLLFSLPVLFLLGGPIVDNVVDAWRRRTVTTDVLILLGVLAAYGYSAVSVIRGQGHVYFEVACMVLVLVTLGRWLEATGKHRASEVLDSLADLLPQQVRVLRSGTIQTVPRDEVTVGERLCVTPGERFAVDGRVVEGRAEVDQQILTGESQPVAKRVGDMTYSGTLNVEGDLVVQVTAAAGSETISRMIELIRQSRYAAGPYQRMADRVAAWFVPAVFVIALGAGAFHATASGLDAGILAALAVVLIACPCALGIATPMAIWSALGRAARRQVLFCSGTAVERLADVAAIRLDKTGTLTTGQASLESFAPDPQTPVDEILGRAGGLAAASSHHFAAAVERLARDRVMPHEPCDVQTIPGRGIMARFGPEGYSVYLGSHAWIEQLGQRATQPLDAIIAEARRSGLPFSCLAWAGRMRAVFTFGEQLRGDARVAVDRCRDLGADVAVLTGDHESRARRIADTLGVPVASEQLPEDKVAAVRRAHEQFGSVAMVGDGINDAPALAAADVGVAMGCGADLSRDTAAVCLLSNDLVRLPWAIQFARRTRRIIRQNLFWAFAYNSLGIVLAVSGRLNPIWAAVAMAGSSFLVISNSLRLTREEKGADIMRPAKPAEPDADSVSEGTATNRESDAQRERQLVETSG